MPNDNGQQEFIGPHGPRGEEIFEWLYSGDAPEVQTDEEGNDTGPANGTENGTENTDGTDTPPPKSDETTTFQKVMIWGGLGFISYQVLKGW